MKRSILTLAIVVLTSAGAPAMIIGSMCGTIQDGYIYDSNNNVITTGFDDWGYNYQGRKFSSLYDNFSRPGQPWTEDDCSGAPNGCVNLDMKWDEMWLSNQDCNGDGELDRPTDDGTYRGTGAWITNHMSGSYDYFDDRGKLKDAHWTYFVKIVAAPSDAVVNGAYWYEADGTELGQVIWGDFAIVQSIYNDPVGGFTGVEYLTPSNPGFGNK